jgi:hypothetical protein
MLPVVPHRIAPFAGESRASVAAPGVVTGRCMRVPWTGWPSREWPWAGPT